MSLISLFLASFFGSLHCVAMCGGFVATYAAAQRANPGTNSFPKYQWISHLLYNIGRLLSYSFLVTIIWLMSEAVSEQKWLSLLVGSAPYVTSLLLIVYGVSQIIKSLSPDLIFIKSFKLISGGKISRVVHASATACYKFVLRRSLMVPLLMPFLLGIATTFLPCSFLYLFVLQSVAAPNLAAAYLAIIIFWIGTLPMMMALGYMVKRSWPWLHKIAPLLSALFIIIAGVYSFSMHYQQSHHCHTAQE